MDILYIIFSFTYNIDIIWSDVAAETASILLIGHKKD